MGAKTLWLMNLVVVALLTAAPASAQVGLAIEVQNALKEGCALVDLATTISQQFYSFGKALQGPNLPTGMSNQLGQAGQDKIRDLLHQRGLPYDQEIRFTDVQSQVGRRGDFVIQKDLETVWIEVKNKQRITIGDVTQIGHYGGDHTIVAVRPGAKISRAAAAPLIPRWKAGLISVVECLSFF